ncbi:hypothetical protein pb186bvf_005298 [Paramecium bursaria]
MEFMNKQILLNSCIIFYRLLNQDNNNIQNIFGIYLVMIFIGRIANYFKILTIISQIKLFIALTDIKQKINFLKI